MRDVLPPPGLTREYLVGKVWEALDEDAAKRDFWSGFKVLGEWYDNLPPY